MVTLAMHRVITYTLFGVLVYQVSHEFIQPDHTHRESQDPTYTTRSETSIHGTAVSNIQRLDPKV